MNMSNFHWIAWLRSTKGQIVLILLTIATVYLITEHTAHVLQVLPYGLVILCPLLMLFIHGGPGDRSGHDQHHETSSHAESHNLRNPQKFHIEAKQVTKEVICPTRLT
jgi:uncharacterized membrane protein